MLHVTIKSFDTDSGLATRAFNHNGQLYLWFLPGTSDNRADHENCLAAVLASVKTAKRDDAPADAVRANLKDFTDLSQLLACVRGLAEIGEYREAALELSSLRPRSLNVFPRARTTAKSRDPQLRHHPDEPGRRAVDVVGLSSGRDSVPYAGGYVEQASRRD